MSHTQNTVAGAIARSISHDEMVTVKVGSEEDITGVYNVLIADPLCGDHDKVHVTPTLMEVWGTTDDGDTWRVCLIQGERTSWARFQE